MGSRMRHPLLGHVVQDVPVDRVKEWTAAGWQAVNDEKRPVRPAVKTKKK